MEGRSQRAGLGGRASTSPSLKWDDGNTQSRGRVGLVLGSPAGPGCECGWGVPQVADAHQAGAVHLQDSVSQRQPAVGRCGAAREQRLDVEARGAQWRMLEGTRWTQGSVDPNTPVAPERATSAPHLA